MQYNGISCRFVFGFAGIYGPGRRDEITQEVARFCLEKDVIIRDNQCFRMDWNDQHSVALEKMIKENEDNRYDDVSFVAMFEDGVC